MDLLLRSVRCHSDDDLCGCLQHCAIDPKLTFNIHEIFISKTK